MRRWSRYPLLTFGIFGLTSLGDACSVASGWQRTSDANQAGAAQVVLQGVADGAWPCMLDPSIQFDGDGGMDIYHYRSKDEELFNESGLCSSSWESVVMVRNLTVTKGSATCQEALIGGFSSSAACGTDPPSFGVRGTYFLCQVESIGNLCKGVLNTNGNIHLGFSTSVSVDVNATHCFQGDVCVDVRLCPSFSSGFLWVPSPWMMMLLFLSLNSKG